MKAAWNLASSFLYGSKMPSHQALSRSLSAAAMDSTYLMEHPSA